MEVTTKEAVQESKSMVGSEMGECSSGLNDLMMALAKAQAEMKIAGKSSNNPFFKSKYADLASVIEASRPSLAKYGLCVIQRINISPGGGKELITILGHASGQYITSRVPLNPLKEDMQSLGSAITYMRRYAYASLVGVVADEEDDDGEAAMRPVRSTNGNGKSNGNGYEKISIDQYNVLNRALNGDTELAESIMKGFGITALMDLPKARFDEIHERVLKIKGTK